MLIEECLDVETRERDGASCLGLTETADDEEEEEMDSEEEDLKESTITHPPPPVWVQRHQGLGENQPRL